MTLRGWAIFSAFFYVVAVHAEVIISGAGSIGRFLELHQTELETASGQPIKIKIKNSVRGLNDLIAGSANLAIVSGDTKRFYRANDFGDQVTASFNETVVGKGKVAFVVNSANKVKSLNVAQVRAILSGQVMNWKEVGGPDSPILIFCVDKTVGFRQAVDETLGIDAYGAGTFTRPNSADILPSIKRYPGAISYINQWDMEPSLKVVNNSAVSFPIVVVSNGTPSPAAASVIKAISEIMKK